MSTTFPATKAHLEPEPTCDEGSQPSGLQEEELPKDRHRHASDLGEERLVDEAGRGALQRRVDGQAEHVLLEVYVGAVEGDHGDQLTQKVFQLVVRALERQDQVVKQAAKYRLDFLRKKS